MTPPTHTNCRPRFRSLPAQLPACARCPRVCGGPPQQDRQLAATARCRPARSRSRWTTAGTGASTFGCCRSSEAPHFRRQPQHPTTTTGRRRPPTTRSRSTRLGYAAAASHAHPAVGASKHAVFLRSLGWRGHAVSGQRTGRGLVPKRRRRSGLACGQASRAAAVAVDHVGWGASCRSSRHARWWCEGGRRPRKSSPSTPSGAATSRCTTCGSGGRGGGEKSGSETAETSPRGTRLDVAMGKAVGWSGAARTTRNHASPRICACRADRHVERRRR